jgi:hypothetical protein
MIHLYRDPGFTFRFNEDRIIPRIHLEGAIAGTLVELISLSDASEKIATAIVALDGWVELDPPLIVRAGTGFVAYPKT